MATATKTMSRTSTANKQGQIFGKMYSFATSLKLYHWHVTGQGSYAQHMALDQALESLTDILDRIVETSYVKYGAPSITVPETKVPTDIARHCEKFYDEMQTARKLFSEEFTDSIIDDWQEGVQQLLYRLRRLQ